jgi:thiamine kinase-like enzyme
MGSTNNEVSVPPWLNAELMAEIISEEKNKNICITDLDVKAAIPKGNNYLSTLYRIIVEFNDSKDGNGVNKRFLILKTLPPGNVLQKILSDMQCFEKELQMYEATIPAMKDVLTNGKRFHPFARYFPTKSKNVIVLEDLQHLGYKMANRHTGLDLEHCKMVVKALAKFHATSVALHKTDPSSMDMYSEGLYRNTKEGRDHIKNYFEKSMNALASNIEKWSGYERYSDRIRRLIPTAVDQIMEAIEPNKNSLNVLNHGDCWVNNILFRYCPKTGRIDDVKFIDFQITRFSSPALDLQYFLCTSTNDDIRFRERDHLLTEYHEELTDTLRSLGIDPEELTLQQLKEEFERKEVFGLLQVITMLSAILASSSEVPDLSEIKEDSVENGEHPMEKAIDGKRYREVVQTFLHHYENKGLL